MLNSRSSKPLLSYRLVSRSKSFTLMVEVNMFHYNLMGFSKPVTSSMKRLLHILHNRMASQRYSITSLLNAANACSLRVIFLQVSGSLHLFAQFTSWTAHLSLTSPIPLLKKLGLASSQISQLSALLAVLHMFTFPKPNALNSLSSQRNVSWLVTSQAL